VDTGLSALLLKSDMPSHLPNSLDTKVSIRANGERRIRSPEWERRATWELPSAEEATASGSTDEISGAGTPHAEETVPSGELAIRKAKIRTLNPSQPDNRAFWHQSCQVPLVTTATMSGPQRTQETQLDHCYGYEPEQRELRYPFEFGCAIIESDINRWLKTCQSSIRNEQPRIMPGSISQYEATSDRSTALSEATNFSFNAAHQLDPFMGIENVASDLPVANFSRNETDNSSLISRGFDIPPDWILPFASNFENLSLPRVHYDALPEIALSAVHIKSTPGAPIFRLKWTARHEDIYKETKEAAVSLR
jgi:hypothetical protein